MNSPNFKLSSCKCQFWYKNKVCKHVIAVSSRLNLCNIPTPNIAIESNSKRERKAKVGISLTYDEYIALNTQLFPQFSSTAKSKKISSAKTVEPPSQPKRKSPRFR